MTFTAQNTEGFTPLELARANDLFADRCPNPHEDLDNADFIAAKILVEIVRDRDESKIY